MIYIILSIDKADINAIVTIIVLNHIFEWEKLWLMEKAIVFATD
jgi:hypothetical protein